MTKKSDKADRSGGLAAPEKRCRTGRGNALLGVLLGAVLVNLAPARAAAQEGAQVYLKWLQSAPYLHLVTAKPEVPVSAYTVPLGAMRKIRGVWAPRRSERVSGLRRAYTWRVEDGFSVAEVIADLDRRLAEDTAAEIRFRCDARACGSSVQWANRIFGERLLYGTQASQRYRLLVFPTAKARQQRLLIYGSARSNERQYLRVELLTSAPST